MRAMLISFASHHLWLHWEKTAYVLARLLLITNQAFIIANSNAIRHHEINTIRIYNPIKQSIEKDPHGAFIKRWIPELRSCPTDDIHRPWNSSISFNYPAPIIDEAIGRQHAAKHLYDLRKKQGFRSIAKGIVKKHASRKKHLTKKKTKTADDKQLSFNFASLNHD